MNSRLILLVAAAFVLGGLGAFASFHLSGNAAKQIATQVTGKALVGGPFALTDHKGRRVTEQDFEGGFMLVYFGFTYCPDICPTELQTMTEALERLGEKANEVTPLFITVDPERDTVEQLASYVSNFHDRLIGLTGSPAEIRAVAKAYHVYYARVKDSTSSTDYAVDHSSVVYLMGPKGDYVDHFSFGTDPQKMADGIAKFL